jgi:hypothetical protein
VLETINEKERDYQSVKYYQELPSLLYYRFQEGDDLVSELTCFQACLYYLLKTERNHGNQDIFEIFLRDINFGVEETSAGTIHDFCFLDRTIHEYGFQKHYVLGKGTQVLSEVEELLDRGKAVIIQTYIHRVPFFKDFFGFEYDLDEEYYQNNYQLHHTFLVVGHDRDNLYYVEAPYNRNPDRYISHEANPTIGVILKQEMYPAFDAFFNYTYLDIDEEKMANMFEVVAKVIRQSIENYNPLLQTLKNTTPNNTSNNINYYFGREAITRTIAHLTGDSFDFLQKIPQYGITLGDLLIWKLQDINNRRRLLGKALIKYRDSFECGDAEGIIQLLAKLSQAWQISIANFIKMRYKKKYVMDDGFRQVLLGIPGLEEELVNQLQSLGWLSKTGTRSVAL